MTAPVPWAEGDDPRVGYTVSRPLTATPSIGRCLAIAAAAAAGATVLLPVWALLQWQFGWGVLWAVVVIWVLLGLVFLIPSLAHAIQAEVASNRAPTGVELTQLQRALGPVCTAGGIRPDVFRLRVAKMWFNATYSSDSTVAVSADVLGGALFFPPTYVQAMVAHEVGHHVHRDQFLTGAVYWYLMPVHLVDRVVLAIARLGAVGRLVGRFILWLTASVTGPFRFLWGISSRRREFMADAFAVACGYGRPLRELLAHRAALTREDLVPSTERLLDTHPSTADRIQRIDKLLAAEATRIREGVLI